MMIWQNRNMSECFKVFYVKLYVHSLVDKLKWFYENARCYNKKYMSFVAQQIALVADTARLLPAKCEQLVGFCFRDRQHFSKPASHYTYSPVDMWWHMVTHGRGSEGETGEWSG